MTKRPADAPLQTYGLPISQGHGQLQYDMLAFAKRLPADTGCPPRVELFRRIADQILPGYFEWHDWCLRLVDALCHNSLVGITGCSNCVAGHTRILNPITGHQPTIKYLYENGIAPIVMTLEGPRQAGVPFIKGVDEIFEVTLENGTSFCATENHRVLTSAGGYKHVRELSLQDALPSYAQRHSGKVVSSQCDYRKDFCFGDEQFLLEEDTYQVPFPSLIGVQGRSRQHLRGDGPCNRRGYNPSCAFSYPPSTLRFFHQTDAAGIPDCHQFFERISSPALRSYQQHCQFSLGNNHCSPTVLPSLGSSRSLSGVACSAVLDSYGFKMAQTCIRSIRKIGKAPFYDLSVPGPQHYFAEGTIHHNSAKTYHSAGFAVVWWLCAPWWSSVMFISTSIKMLRRRAWANISKAYSMMGENRFGNFVDSRIMWQLELGNDLNAICGKAVEDGSITKVADDIKGVHTIRQLILLDEATAIPPAIWDAASNLWSYPAEFILCSMGNIRSRLDSFGRWCEPKEGWGSVSVEDDEWEGQPQKEYGGRVPFVVHFDAERSPNITEGKIISRHLPQREKVEAAKKHAGNSPLYWSNMRGFPPVEGIEKTVFTETLLYQHDAFGMFQFADGATITVLGFLDPAFGGNDRAIFTPALMGEIHGRAGVVGIQALPPIHIQIDASVKSTVHYQLCDNIIACCERIQYNGRTYRCPIQNLGIDATGEGGGLCSIVERKTGNRIVWVEFGGSASVDIVNLEDGRMAKDVYQNKRAEMHFRCRDAVQAGQFKGFSREAAAELTMLKFDDEKKRIVMMAKKDFKKEFHRSPDYGDSLIGLTEVARMRGFRLAAVDQTVNRYADFEKQSRLVQDIFTDTYAPEEMVYDSTY